MAFLRISVGTLFLIFGQYKVFGRQFTLHGGFQFWINKFLEDGAYPFMVPVLRGFVLPHGTSIAFLVAYGELAIGLALLLGVLADDVQRRIALALALPAPPTTGKPRDLHRPEYAPGLRHGPEGRPGAVPVPAK